MTIWQLVKALFEFIGLVAGVLIGLALACVVGGWMRALRDQIFRRLRLGEWEHPRDLL